MSKPHPHTDSTPIRAAQHNGATHARASHHLAGAQHPQRTESKAFAISKFTNKSSPVYALGTQEQKVYPTPTKPRAGGLWGTSLKGGVSSFQTQLPFDKPGSLIYSPARQQPRWGSVGLPGPRQPCEPLGPVTREQFLRRSTPISGDLQTDGGRQEQACSGGTRAAA